VPPFLTAPGPGTDPGPEITPSFGSPFGNQTVRISGLTAAAPGSTVTFGGVPALQVSYGTDTGPFIDAVTPPGGGPVDVVVTPPGGGPAQHLSFDYEELILSVTRPDDMLSVSFQLINLKPDGTDVVRIDPAADAFVIVYLGAQHIAEANTDFGSSAPTPPVSGVLAGGSQLAFRVPAATTRLPLTVESLLDWDALTLVPGAGTAGTHTRPSGNDTSLELPYRMFLTVDDLLGWQLPPPPAVPPPPVSELWRATMRNPALRVTWSTDLQPNAAGGADPGTPDAANRQAIAGQAPALTSGDLTLSALGASVDLQVALTGTDVDFWREVVDYGRDSAVRVVLHGFLAPWGHRAALFEAVDRQPQAAADGTALAGLTGRKTLVVTEPVVSYAQPSAGADGPQPPLPFVSARITTLVVAQTDVPDEQIATVDNGSGGLFQFQLLATDHGGEEVNLTMPLVFVPASLVSDATTIANKVQSIGLVQLGGQPVNFIPPPAATASAQPRAGAATASRDRALTAAGDVGTAAGDVGTAANAAANAGRLAVSNLQLIADSASAAVPSPQLFQAMVTVPGSEVAGAAAAMTIQYHQAYLASGFSAVANPGQLFAQVPSSPTLGLPADAAGGLASPALAVHNLSQAVGPVGDIDSMMRTGALQAKDILDSAADAKLLGGLTLADFLPDIPQSDFSLDKLPQLLHTPLPNGVQVSFDWSPPLKSASGPGSGPSGSGSGTGSGSGSASGPGSSSSVPTGLDVNLDKSTLTLRSVSTVYLDGTAHAVVTGTLTDPVLTFFQAVILKFDSLTFTAESGKKPKLTMGHMGFQLQGDLSFLATLAELLPAGGFGDAPALNAIADGITAGYSVALPAIGLGILSIENVAVAASLSLPFSSPLGLKVAFSTRDHPFLVTVSLLGGGGYFVIDVGSDGIHQIEGSLELAAQLDIDLLIVTANVHAMAGFYFKVDSTGTSFSGFVRIGGSVDLLGLISVSIELYLALAYDSVSDSIFGSATLTLSVHVLFVTKSLTLSAEKRFPVPGSSSSPRALRPAAALAAPAGGAPPAAGAPPGEPAPAPLDSWMTIDEWRTYCQAFAGGAA
jgi:hypothetical protein